MIELKNLSKFYNTNNVVSLGLKNINLKLEKGEIVALCGESGSGKSTLLNVITKMDTFDEGEYFYYDEETSYYDIEDMDLFRKNKVGFIFQNYNIIESYTVLENVMLPLKILGYTNKNNTEIYAPTVLFMKGRGIVFQNKDTIEKHYDPYLEFNEQFKEGLEEIYLYGFKLLDNE